MIALPQPPSTIPGPQLAVVRDPQPPVVRDYLSFSAIRAYQGCPLRYYFRYVAGLPEETVSTSLVFGSAIHRAIEAIYRHAMIGERVELSRLLDEYDAVWREEIPERIRWGERENAASLRAQAEALLRAFLARYEPSPPARILAIEETFRQPIIEGVPDLLGRVDLIVERDRELVIADWKTSRSRWSDGQVIEAAEQLLLYAELVGDLAPGKPIRLEFTVLAKTKIPTIDTHGIMAEPAAIERMKRVVGRVWNAIEQQHFYPAPSPLQCGGCSFQTVCRAWPG